MYSIIRFELVWIGSVLKIKPKIWFDPSGLWKIRSNPIQTFAILINFLFKLDWFNDYDWIWISYLNRSTFYFWVCVVQLYLFIYLFLGVLILITVQLKIIAISWKTLWALLPAGRELQWLDQKVLARWWGSTQPNCGPKERSSPIRNQERNDLLVCVFTSIVFSPHQLELTNRASTKKKGKHKGQELCGWGFRQW